MPSAFDSNDCEILARALEQACAIFLKTGQLTTNVDLAKAALTLALLEAAQSGERNPQRLAIAAVGQMARFEDPLRNQRSFSAMDHRSV